MDLSGMVRRSGVGNGKGPFRAQTMWSGEVWIGRLRWAVVMSALVLYGQER